MKKRIILITILLIIILCIGLLSFWILPLNYQKECRERVFNDLQDKVLEAQKSIVGIIPEGNNDGLKSHNGIGSGVIFDKQDNRYYVVTAAHVINKKDSLFKIFTINTEFSGKTINVADNIDFEIPDDDYYASLLDGKIEYISNSNDLAILSFETKEELPVLEFERTTLKKDDRIVAIGHPEGNRYQKTYGYIQSDLKEVKIKSKGTDNVSIEKVMEHNAYMNFGNSGGVALSENMKIAGVNVGGKFNLLGYFETGLMIHYDIIEENINIWKNS